MTTARQRVIDLLAIGRVANLPTVVSNVLLGFALGTFTVTWIWSGEDFDLARLAFAILAGMCLYLGGCFLNDWRDAAWDRKHRPERAIPRGAINSWLAAAIAGTFLIGGTFIASLVSFHCLLTAGAIVAAIAVYTAIHKTTPWAIIPMGLCRALLYPLGFLAAYQHNPLPDDFGLLGESFHHDVYVSYLFGLIRFEASWSQVDLINGIITLTVVSVGLLFYVAAISLIARFESRGILHRSYLIIGLGLILVAACAHALFWFPDYPLASGLALLPLIILAGMVGMRTRKNVGKGVGLLLAGLPLLDLVSAGPLAVALYSDHPQPALFWGAAPVACFLLALLLQRIAPAT
jgi:hypothetical protein